MSRELSLAVVGATDAAGNEILRVLEERRFPLRSLRLLAAEESAGDFLEFGGEDLPVEALCADSFAAIDIAFFAAGAGLSRAFSPAATAAGALCIDGSGAWQADPSVPLVAAELNGDALAGCRGRGIVATPGAATLLLASALKPLRDCAGIRRVVVSTYQSVSSSGQAAIDELRIQTGELLNGRPAESKVYPHQIAFNCLPQVGAFAADGYSDEEHELVAATRRILGDALRVTATAVRVPLFYGLSLSVNIETEQGLGVEQARELLRNAPGCRLLDDPLRSLYPMPLDAAGEASTLVGRVRADESVACGLNLWLCADNLRKEAANAVQVAELLAERYL